MRRFTFLAAALMLLLVLPAPSATAAEGPDAVPFIGTFSNALGCTYSNGCGGGYHGYPAIDFMVAAGTVVRAAGPGQVIARGGCHQTSSPGCNSGFGNYVEIVHPNGQRSFYAHLATITAPAAVSRGQEIGRTGNSGTSFGSHLHYEERNGAATSTRVDPGAMRAVHGGGAVSYPQAWGPYSSWSQVPCGAQPDEPCSARHTLRNDGYHTGAVPFGSFDEPSSPEAGTVRVRGWVIDDDARTSPTGVHVYIGGPAGPGAEGHDLGPADAHRPDVGAAHPGAGDHHGFDRTVATARTGEQQVCAYGINTGGGDNPLLGCRTVTIADPHPFGAHDEAIGGAGEVRVRGWAIDRSAPTTPLSVHVYVGGQAGENGAESHDVGQAADARPDVARAHPWAGERHGFDVRVVTSKRGSQPVCAYAINLGIGENRLLGCGSATITEPARPDPGPTSPPPSSPPTPGPTDPPSSGPTGVRAVSLSLSATTVTAGNTPQLQGRATGATGAAVPGRSVTIHAKSWGDSNYRTLQFSAPVTTDGDGAFAAHVRPYRQTTYVVVIGDVQSRPGTVYVATRINFTAPPSRVARAAWLSGDLDPDLAGASVGIARMVRRDGRWVPEHVGTVRTGASGRFAARPARGWSSGRHTYVLTVRAGSGLLASRRNLVVNAA